MVRTGTKSREEVDKGEEHTTTVTMAITITVTETIWLQNIHLKKIERRSDFQTNNYQNLTQILSIQED